MQYLGCILPGMSVHCQTYFRCTLSNFSWCINTGFIIKHMSELQCLLSSWLTNTAFAIRHRSKCTMSSFFLADQYSFYHQTQVKVYSVYFLLGWSIQLLPSDTGQSVQCLLSSWLINVVFIIRHISKVQCLFSSWNISAGSTVRHAPKEHSTFFIVHQYSFYCQTYCHPDSFRVGDSLHLCNFLGTGCQPSLLSPREPSQKWGCLMQGAISEMGMFNAREP